MLGGETHSGSSAISTSTLRATTSSIRRLIPYYDEMIEVGVDLPAALAPAHAHVLDFGGGTGALQ